MSGWACIRWMDGKYQTLAACGKHCAQGVQHIGTIGACTQSTQGTPCARDFVQAKWPVFVFQACCIKGDELNALWVFPYCTNRRASPNRPRPAIDFPVQREAGRQCGRDRRGVDAVPLFWVEV